MKVKLQAEIDAHKEEMFRCSLEDAKTSFSRMCSEIETSLTQSHKSTLARMDRDYTLAFRSLDEMTLKLERCLRESLVALLDGWKLDYSGEKKDISQGGETCEKMELDESAWDDENEMLGVIEEVEGNALLEMDNESSDSDEDLEDGEVEGEVRNGELEDDLSIEPANEVRATPTTGMEIKQDGAIETQQDAGRDETAAQQGPISKNSWITTDNDTNEKQYQDDDDWETDQEDGMAVEASWERQDPHEENWETCSAFTDEDGDGDEDEDEDEDFGESES